MKKRDKTTLPLFPVAAAAVTVAVAAAGSSTAGQPLSMNPKTVYNRKWRAANPERYHEAHRAWWAKNKDKYVARQREKGRQYRATHVEQIRKKHHEYEVKNLGKIRTRDRERRAAHPGMDALRKRCRKYGITKEQLASLLETGSCDLCGSHNPGGNGKARWSIDHHGGKNGLHDARNVRGILCRYCNAHALVAAEQYVRFGRNDLVAPLIAKYLADPPGQRRIRKLSVARDLIETLDEARGALLKESPNLAVDVKRMLSERA